jgi:hypothetical protein
MKAMCGYFIINICRPLFVEKIKKKARLWMIAGAKRLEEMIPEE